MRVHVLSMSQQQDVRPDVNVKVTEEMREQARGVLKRYPDGPPNRGKPAAPANAVQGFNPYKAQRVFVVHCPGASAGRGSSETSAGDDMALVSREAKVLPLEYPPSAVLSSGPLVWAGADGCWNATTYQVHPIAGRAREARVVLADPVPVGEAGRGCWAATIDIEHVQSPSAVAMAVQKALRLEDEGVRDLQERHRDLEQRVGLAGGSSGSMPSNKFGTRPCHHRLRDTPGRRELAAREN